MPQLIFAILMMASAWAAWRRNPAYSARTTLRAVVVVTLGIAGVIALIIAAVTLTNGKSEAVVFSTMAAVLVFGTLALIFLIMAVSVPKESKPAALPHSAKLVTNNRRKMIKWVKALAILIAILAMGSLIPNDVRYVFLTLGGLTLFLAIILLPVLYFTSRGFDQSLTEIQLHPWVHWQYAPEQWRQWSNLQADRAAATPASFVLKRDWHRFLWPFAAIIGGVAWFVPGSWLFKSIYLSVVCGAILALAVFGGRGPSATSEKLRTQLLQASPEAWFGRDGVFCDGVFTPWLNVSTYLVSAAIDEREPRSLLLNFERSVPNPYGPTQTIPIHQHVLIPANAGGDLARLQQELTARCAKAQINIA